MPSPTTVANDHSYRVTIITLDGHLAGASARAFAELRSDMPGLKATMHCAGEWKTNPEQLEECIADIAQADIVVACMLFLDEHIQQIAPALKARRDHCDAMVCFMSDGEIMKLTRIGQFKMDGEATGVMKLLKRLRGSNKENKQSSGEKQVAMLQRLPRILRFIPGTAQDVRAYFLTMQYWLAGSEKNIANMVRYLAKRYAIVNGKPARGESKVPMPIQYPQTGLYHPELEGGVSEHLKQLPAGPKNAKGTVGLLVMRSYVLAGNCQHYDSVIKTMESQSLRVIPVFASGLDARPAVNKFFMEEGRATVDAVLSLTGFSLVGGPAYNDSAAAEELLATLDVPYLAAHCTEFQTLEEWQDSDRGLLPVETTLMVAIPELDGAISPTLFAGRSSHADAASGRDMVPQQDRIDVLVARTAKMVALRKTARADRKIGVMLFNFPPNAGATGSAAFLAVFESLFNTLHSLADAGYNVDLPESVDQLRDDILNGNREQYGTDANVLDIVSTDHHVRNETHLKQIEECWGPAPGKQLSNGEGLFVLGKRYNNVVVAVQPSFGYEGDPMRLLFEKGHTPTHAFSAFYRYLREEVGVNALLNFGTHGALEFMPGKQVGMSDSCWPERLLGDIPNFYLYAANNPSEGMLAKRRSAATLISYLTPAITQAGLHKELNELQAVVDRWREQPPEAVAERAGLAEMIHGQALALELIAEGTVWSQTAEPEVAALVEKLTEYKEALIPNGMHVIGQPIGRDEQRDFMKAMSGVDEDSAVSDDVIEQLIDGDPVADIMADSDLEEEQVIRLSTAASIIAEEHNIERDAIIQALDGRYIRPVAGGDLVKTPEILPTGRNIHGFDPFRIPSAFAMTDGARQAQLLIDKHVATAGRMPESVAFVLWGTDNLKSEGGPIAQVLALMGAIPRMDSYGRLCGAELIPLDMLGRPRIDVVMTLSGIFRDLMPHQIEMLAEASYLAACADEPVEQNFIRKHALAYMESCDCDLETASMRVFSNAEGAYGGNVNFLVENSRWEDEDELANTYMSRKCFVYGRDGQPRRQAELLQRSLQDVDLAYQNIESVELGVTAIDNYFDTLGGITKAAERAGGKQIEVYIGDQTDGNETVRTLADQVALEAHSRMLNPTWYEGMLRHGYEGVRQIESHVTNTMGLSATTGKVAPWVYEKLTQLYILDPEMRNRMAELNPTASARVVGRLLEAQERNYWSPDAETLEQIRDAGDELDDRLEGVNVEGINEVAVA
ncbi:MAG: magnesium chelatase subunit H [Gammaproteobacteria bacterium]